MSSIDPSSVRKYFVALQNRLCAGLEKEDESTKFIEDCWQREQGGGGRTRALENGEYIEKAGVNFSHVYGNNLPATSAAQRPELTGSAFEAMGVSLIVHPRSPFAPTTHFNLRFFLATPAESAAVWWFGGGFDLTPYYGFKEDCVHWHRTAKAACDPFGEGVYAQFKQACDEYFFLKHRQEPRGIGGIFFDNLNVWGFEQSFAFIQRVGENFMQGYQPILARRKKLSYGTKEREFQCYRRGRYVEFNLLYDRGTLFGLQTGGRTESILISLPPQVTWRYDWQPEPGSREASLYTDFLKPRDWASVK